MKKSILIGVFFVVLAVVGLKALSPQTKTGSGASLAPAGLSPRQELGKKLFFDRRLSSPEGQACAACHSPLVGWTGPEEAVNKTGGVYEGAVKGRFGNRKPPASGYAGESPLFHQDKDDKFGGGMFWDGRAAGGALGDPLAEQAMSPFLNPLEQNNPDKKSIIDKIKGSDYAGLFEKVWGPGSLDAGRPDATFEKIARSIAAFERSAEVNPFSSKFDDFWRAARAVKLDVAVINDLNMGRFENRGLDPGEIKGLVLFATKGKCAACHSLASVAHKPPLFTDFTYDNLGLPKNPLDPFYGMAKVYNPDGKNWVDKGLGGSLEGSVRYAKEAAANIGKHKVPTLRNVDRRPSPGFVKAYMHNGCFKSLKDIVHFYNARDKVGAKFPVPEVKVNINTTEMGNLGLMPEEEDLIVLFLKTLTDK